MRILLVDADPKCRKDFKDLLESQGYKVVTSTDGLVALEQLTRKRKIKFHLVLTDTKMPCMSGPELAEDMKQRGIKIPVIGMSNREECREFYKHFWNKNELPEKLFALIKELTAKSP